MLRPRPPHTEPYRGGDMLPWSRQVNESLRRICHALGTISLPQQRGSKASSFPSSSPHPWKYTPSQFVPSNPEADPPEQPPADQPRRFTVRPGAVMAGNALFPLNMNEEFVVPDNTEDFCVYLAATIQPIEGTEALGGVDVEIRTGETLPTAEIVVDVEKGNYPGTVYLPLFRLTTADNRVTKVDQLVKTCVSLTLVLQGFACGTATRNVFWSSL